MRPIRPLRSVMGSCRCSKASSRRFTFSSVSPVRQAAAKGDEIVLASSSGGGSSSGGSKVRDREGARPFALTTPQADAQLFPRDVQDTAQAVSQRLVKEALEHHFPSLRGLGTTDTMLSLRLSTVSSEWAAQQSLPPQGFAQEAARAASAQHHSRITDPKLQVRPRQPQATDQDASTAAGHKFRLNCLAPLCSPVFETVGVRLAFHILNSARKSFWHDGALQAPSPQHRRVHRERFVLSYIRVFARTAGHQSLAPPPGAHHSVTAQVPTLACCCSATRPLWRELSSAIPVQEPRGPGAVEHLLRCRARRQIDSAAGTGRGADGERITAWMQRRSALQHTRAPLTGSACTCSMKLLRGLPAGHGGAVWHLQHGGGRARARSATSQRLRGHDEQACRGPRHARPRGL